MIPVVTGEFYQKIWNWISKEVTDERYLEIASAEREYCKTGDEESKKKVNGLVEKVNGSVLRI